MAARLAGDAYAGFADSAARGDPGNPYRDLRYLVVEDNETARQTLRLCLQTLGGFAIDQTQSHGDALHRIRREMPDVIMCDYLLGEGRTGQQLLEQLRRGAELPERAIFIMVTAERAYEKVISVVELAPDDYVLKPFAPEVLRQRLEKVIQKKKAFERFFTLRERARYGEAIAELDHMLSQRANAPYRYDILRSRAVLLLDSGALESAAAAYEAIIAEHPFPWAKAGLARAHHRSLRHDEARAMVDQVIEQVPNYLEAYDLKAEICTRQGAFEEALRTLDAAAKRTPFNLERKKSLSLAAGRAGNFELARALMDEVVRNDVLGDHSAAYLALARCALNESDHLQARALLARATPRDGRYADEEANLSLECMAAVTDELRGDERFDRIRAQIVQRKQFSVNAAIDITRVALHFSDLQLANLVAERTLTGPDARQAFAELLTIYRHENLEQPFRELQREIVSRKVIHHDQPGGLR